MALERTPPEDRLHRRLWAMGFSPTEREKIVGIATRYPWVDPVMLGNFIGRCRLEEVLAKLGVVVGGS